MKDNVTPLKQTPNEVVLESIKGILPDLNALMILGVEKDGRVVISFNATPGEVSMCAISLQSLATRILNGEFRKHGPNCPNAS